MRLLFLGDVVGRAGRKAVIEELPRLRARYKLDFVAINGENAAGGFGITEAILEELLAAGADVVTLGNHAFDQKEALVFIERQERLLRPINYPPGTPGKGAGLFKAAQRRRRAGDQRHGADLHAGARLPVPRRRRGDHRLRPQARGRCDRGRLPRRGDEREAGDGLFRRRAGKLRGRYAHACAHRR